MKRKISLLLVFILLLAIPVNVFAKRHENRDIKIWINDRYIMSDVHPYIKNNRTFVPLRFVSEELGYKVTWEGKSRSVIVEDGSNKLIFKVGSAKVNVNGNFETIDAPVGLRDDRTFVPLRFISERMGGSVGYDVTNKVALIGNVDDYIPDAYYEIKYYEGNNQPIILNFTVNFYTMEIKDSSGKTIQFNDDREVVTYLEKNPQAAPESTNNVPTDKQLKDQYYVSPEYQDPFVGSWYGRTKTIGTNEYYDAYAYIESTGKGKYTIRHRSIKSNGSELVTESNAFINEDGNFEVEASHATTLATGDFSYSWYHVHEEYIFDGVGYMYESSDPLRNLTKY
ncbi:copper amine oxidase N-terminal domain-containing protein [Peptoniphilus catoniae]|uniref:copper amine oxidase N-terminal domain-containing protein n=1 Tax=Peptoniphilus catoniae TaxID=1660341 RepID=UPI0015D6259A|nr:copper amine oxidase N-terminal domain-containing protein [Peptoniphilus catoniae]